MTRRSVLAEYLDASVTLSLGALALSATNPKLNITGPASFEEVPQHTRAALTGLLLLSMIATESRFKAACCEDPTDESEPG